MKVVKDRAGKSYSIDAKVHVSIHSALQPLIGGTVDRAQSSLALWGVRYTAALIFGFLCSREELRRDKNSHSKAQLKLLSFL